MSSLLKSKLFIVQAGGACYFALQTASDLTGHKQEGRRILLAYLARPFEESLGFRFKLRQLMPEEKQAHAQHVVGIASPNQVARVDASLIGST